MKAKATPLLRFVDAKPEIHYANYFELSDVASWGPRRIPDYELILIVSGIFSYDVAGKPRLTARPGELLCIPPGEEHVFELSGKASKGSACISCVHLEFLEGASRLKGDYAPEIEPPRTTFVKGDHKIHLLFKGVAEARNGYGRRRNEIVQTMVKELILRLAEIWEGGGASLSERARAMAELVESDLQENSIRRKLAKRFKLSPARVDSVFKGELKMTPTEFLHAARVAKGCSLLLEKGLNAKEAASALGFFDESHFSRVFKRYMGMPPSRLVSRKSAAFLGVRREAWR